jgi:hypothetical protein
MSELTRYARICRVSNVMSGDRIWRACRELTAAT